MAPNRVGGPTGPEPNKGQESRTHGQQQHRRLEKVEKVREVDEVENEGTRKKFQQYMMDDEEETTPKAPSPLETNFYFVTGEEQPSKGPSLGAGLAGSPLSTPPPSSAPPGFEDLNESAVPSPNYAPPPNVSAAPPQTPEAASPPPLPRSRNFWSGVDSPPDQPTAPPKYQEQIQSSSRTSSEDKGKGGEQKQSQAAAKKKEAFEDIPLFDEESPPASASKTAKEKETAKKPQREASPPFGAKPEKKREIPASLKDEKKNFAVPKEAQFDIERRPSKDTERSKLQKDEEEPGPIVSRFISKEEEEKGKPISPFSAPERGKRGVEPVKADKKKETEPPPLAKREEKGQEKTPFSIGSLKKERKQEEWTEGGTPIQGEAKPEQIRPEDREGGRGRDREKKTIEIEGPATPQLPSNVVPIAQAAASQAAPYLNRELLPLFFQMVGSIIVMTAPPGISRTEIVLNAPSFASSKFYGSTITIEKYATAPDSLNIRLSGSNEAVQAFNQNIQSLYAAFQNGNFAFRIGRIDAEYSIERPIFRRKGPGEGKRDSGGGGFQDRRK